MRVLKRKKRSAGREGHLVRGMVWGALILGLGGRMLALLMAHLWGLPSHLTVYGVAQVVLLGAGAGILGGLVMGFLRQWYPGCSSLLWGLAGGGLLFLLFLLSALGRGRLPFPWTPMTMMTLGGIVGVCLLWGWLMAKRDRAENGGQAR